MARSQIECICGSTIQIDEDRLDEEIRNRFWRIQASLDGDLEYVCPACRLEDVERRLRVVEAVGSDQDRAIDRLECSRR
jgi:hypothetical protein